MNKYLKQSKNKQKDELWRYIPPPPTPGMVTIDILKSYGAKGALLQHDPGFRTLHRLRMETRGY